MDDKLCGLNNGGWFSIDDNKPSASSHSCGSGTTGGSVNAGNTANIGNTANTGNTGNTVNINNTTNNTVNADNSNSGSHCENNHCGVNQNSCGGSQSCCGAEANGAENMPGCRCVGYGYVPWQMLGEVYQPEQGLDAGTVFPELSLTMEEYGKVCKGGM